jgi:hypothetical protein
MVGWSSDVAPINTHTRYCPVDKEFVRSNDTDSPFEIRSLSLTVNPRHISDAIVTAIRNRNRQVEGYKFIFTPVSTVTVATAETRFSLNLSYRDTNRNESERFDSDDFHISINDSMGVADTRDEGDRWILAPGVVTREAALDIRGRKVQIGDFETDLRYDTVQVQIPRYAQADVVDWRARALVTDAAEIASAVGFTSSKSVAALRFRANRTVAAENITVSIRDIAISDTNRAYNVYLIERGDDITTTVAGVKVTVAAEDIRLSGEFSDTLTFPLANKMLGTYVITTAPLVNVEAEDETEDECDDCDDECDDCDDYDVIDLDDIDDAVSIPVTGGCKCC